MVRKYKFGKPFETEAVIKELPIEDSALPLGRISMEEGFSFSYVMEEDMVVYGLGEANRGINKRGYKYVSLCSDDFNHTEDKVSLYGAHNFILLSGRENVGLFFDYPGEMSFDIGYTRQDTLVVSCGDANLYVYEISGESALDVVKQFREIIGSSYIPPKYAFGFGQSRWGYMNAGDIDSVIQGYRGNHIPIDMVYMDIDYMVDYKDFTVSPERFPDFKNYVAEKRAQNIHLIPIIDAGVKMEEGYDIYEEGREKGYFCKREDGSDFEACVWPGWTHFPDFLNKDAREWFGSKYKVLIDQGIDGFWNDMNEPAIFYSREGINALDECIKETARETLDAKPGKLEEHFKGLQNNHKDYERFYHNVNGEMVRHDKVHNLYGYNMTRAAGEAFARLAPDKEILMFSRASYIGMHRYGGIWTGDNKSWWSHILLNLKMLPSLNMCGFLYCGADLGGFGDNVTRDLLLRWLALGVFTPLMRNHAAIGTRDQEAYRFEGIWDFRHVIGVRYRLVPYLYQAYLKAAGENDMLFKPLAFVYPEDKHCKQVEDQLMLSDEVMIAPVYTQNATGRYVYLPEEMMFIKFLPDGSIFKEVLQKGHHYVEVALNEVPLFIRKGCRIPVAEVALSVPEIDESKMQMVGYDGV